MQKIIFSLITVFFTTSCTFVTEGAKENAVARVGETYLSADETKKLLGEKTSKEDSINIVTNYINNWALKQLFIQKAKANLPDEKLIEFEKLIEQYRADLYIGAYKEALVKKSMDTVVTSDEMKRYYDQNKENFRLNEELAMLRYLHVPKTYAKLAEVKEKFRRYNPKDAEELINLAIQFKAYSFNDSVWVKSSEIIEKVPPLNTENIGQYLNNSQFFELTDSLGVYLVHINKVLKKTDPPPLEYIEPTLRQIILNKRKLEFINRLEKDIIDEAVKKNRFEIYE